MCENIVTVYIGNYYDRDIDLVCGDYYGGQGKQLCNDCYDEAIKEYPQGWRYYPGDTCKHGTYVGGCGIDWLCGRCEDGDEFIIEVSPEQFIEIPDYGYNEWSESQYIDLIYAHHFSVDCIRPYYSKGLYEHDIYDMTIPGYTGMCTLCGGATFSQKCVCCLNHNTGMFQSKYYEISEMSIDDIPY